jgi:hypothetical protein
MQGETRVQPGLCKGCKRISTLCAKMKKPVDILKFVRLGGIWIASLASAIRKRRCARGVNAMAEIGWEPGAHLIERRTAPSCGD